MGMMILGGGKVGMGGGGEGFLGVVENKLMGGVFLLVLLEFGVIGCDGLFLVIFLIIIKLFIWFLLVMLIFL